MSTQYPGTAAISACGLYRHQLTRELDDANARPLVICGLNPSTATAELDDATIRKEIKYAKRWGCGVLVKVNAYDYRATKPKLMFAAAKRGVSISSSQNDTFIRRAVERARSHDGVVLVGWGRNIEDSRQRALAAIIGALAMCLGTNQDGSPVHPLYQKDDATLIPWRLP
jgi:hypothetical protein